MIVSDGEVKRGLIWEYSGNIEKARNYALRIAAVNGPLSAQYARVADMLAIELTPDDVIALRDYYTNRI